MILNETYYQKLLEKFKDVQHVKNDFVNNIVALTVKIVLKHYYDDKPIHINFNFENAEEYLFEIGKHLYVELANDIYNNYHIPSNNFDIGDELKGIKDNQYYKIIKIENNNYTLEQILRKRKEKTDIFPAILTNVTYEKLTKNYVKLGKDTRISNRTIKNYIDFFEKLNNKKYELPRFNFNKKIIFISKKALWDNLDVKNKIPSIYLQNSRKDDNLNEIKSIPALTDCLIYFSTEYEVCYQKILQKKPEQVKSIIVIDPDAYNMEQIIQDKDRFKFNLIILSTKSKDLAKSSSIPYWNWFKEEVELLNGKSFTINFESVPDTEFEKFIKNLDNKISIVNEKFGIQLKFYENILRLAINAIQSDTIENLIQRLKINRELERGLDNFGGYTIDCLENNNPKEELFRLLDYLKKNLPKQKTLINFLNRLDKKAITFVDNDDMDFVKGNIRNRKVEILPFSYLKNIKNKTLVFYSFSGQKDFNLLYNLSSNNDIILVVYEQEKNLYHQYLNKRKNQLEGEIKSKNRLSICGVEYQELKDYPVNISAAIDRITSRLDDWEERIYEGYKNECDILLDDSEEKQIYKIKTNISDLYIESNDTVFTKQGNLIKAYKIKIGDQIRVYPKEQLTENLYQVAVETEPEVFGKVEEHSRRWKELIDELKNKFGDELYIKLKEKGLRIVPNTLASYGKGFIKFPMYKSDLRAIFKLYFSNKSDIEIDELIKPILKSKTIYNRTMIVLGKGLKQELKLFLQENKIGEVLQKQNFTESTLKTFVEEFMPLHTVLNIETFNDNIENLDEKIIKNI